jgi:hypothetical protein
MHARTHAHAHTPTPARTDKTDRQALWERHAVPLVQRSVPCHLNWTLFCNGCNGDALAVAAVAAAGEAVDEAGDVAAAADTQYAAIPETHTHS